MSSIAQQLSNLINPAPVFQDPEDSLDETAAKLTEGAQRDHDLITGSSKLRRQAALLLDNEDVRYAGTRVDRRMLNEHESLKKFHEEADENDDFESDELDESESDEGARNAADVDDDVIVSDEEDEVQDLSVFKDKVKQQGVDHSEAVSGFSFTNESDYSKYADDEEIDDDDDDDEEEDSSDEEEEEEDGSATDDVTDEGVRNFARSNVEAEVMKGAATRSQLALWDSLLEGRIKFQRALIVANQLPQPDMWGVFRDESTEEFSQVVQEGQVVLKSLLDQLVLLQTTLLVNNPETQHVAGSKDGKAATAAAAEAGGEDEEITSESDDASEPEVTSKVTSKQNRKRKLTMDEYPEFLQKRHKCFQKYRNDTIQKWYDKTRVSAGKLGKGFSAFEQSALKQIDQILSDRDRLIKRTQLKRSGYRVLGKAVQQTAAEEAAELDETGSRLVGRDQQKDFDEEIFDDDDFYHQLLRELIERKTSDISDPVALSRQWLEIQKLRSKTKKKKVPTATLR